MLNSLESQTAALYALAHELLYLGVDDRPIYSDHFNHLNREVFRLANALYIHRGATSEEEAALCLSLLMGYTSTIYNNGDKENRIQNILNRCWTVLDELSDSLLKVQLLTYCYGEVYDEDLAQKAHAIINTWSGRDLTDEECEVIDLLNEIEDNPYPWSGIEENLN